MRHPSLYVAALGLAAGCSAPPTQVITGQVATDFPMTVTTVKVTSSAIQSWHGDVMVTSTPVAADGTFSLDVQALTGLRLHLVGNGQSKVVFPRSTGTVDTSFAIRGHGADFDLGMIHFVGSSATTPFVFKTTTGGGSGGGMDCDHDGHDANGATCVDDHDDSNNTCGQDDHHGGHDQMGDQGGDDGDDQMGGEGGANVAGSHTGGGVAIVAPQGEQDGDQNDGADMGDAVADHNFPADGCNDDHHHGHGHGHGDGDGDGHGGGSGSGSN